MKDLLLQNQICFPVYTLSRLITQCYVPFLKQFDITYLQYLVLLVLWEKSPLTVSAIGEKLLLDSGTLSPLLKKLESKGFITRQRDAADDRKVIITLTTAGKQLQSKAKAVPMSMVEELGIKSAELKALKNQVDNIIDQIKNR